MKVLLIESESRIFIEMNQVIEQAGFDVLPASTLREGKRLLETDRNLDIIIMGDFFPGEKPEIFIADVKRTLRYKNIPIMMTSSSWSPQQISQYAELGVESFVILPLNVETIEEKINNMVSAGKQTILIVDDDEMICSLLKKVMEIERFKVHVATNGKEALEIIENNTIHAVVSDILMPGMTGIELLEIIKEKYTWVPVIMITGFSGKYSPQDAIAAGADGFFSKPFKNIEIIQKLRSILSNVKTTTSNV